MQRYRYLFPSLLLLLTLTFGCADKTVKVYMANVPNYMEKDTWRSEPIAFTTPTALKTPGKIYLYNNLLIVNEFLKGVHIYDNANPASPIDLGFLPVLANQDIAVRNNVLYLDSYTDLLSFDISDPRHPSLLARVNDVFDFTNQTFLPGFDDKYPMVNIDDTKGVVTSWNVKETTEEIYGYYQRGGFMTMDMLSNTAPTGTNVLPGGAGLAGSTARFAIWDHYLYTLENWQLGVFDIQDGVSHISDVALTRSSETLFPQDGFLFIGTTTGMLIYNLNNGSNPSFVSDYSHISSCDPVVVQGDKAFITLSMGRNCHTEVHTLQVVDLSNITMPTLLYEFPMTNPKGLGVDGNTLFVCDGEDGLKVFDKTDLSMININLISQFAGITAADVIPNNQVLLMTAEDGIHQYSYADLQNITQLSLIPVQH